MSNIEHRVRQIASIEPGWRYWAVVNDNEMWSLRVVGLAVVDSTGWRDDDGGNTETDRQPEFLIFDDTDGGGLKSESEFKSDCENSNVAPVGATPPGEALTLDDARVQRAIQSRKSIEAYVRKTRGEAA